MCFWYFRGVFSFLRIPSSDPGDLQKNPLVNKLKAKILYFIVPSVPWLLILENISYIISNLFLKILLISALSPKNKSNQRSLPKLNNFTDRYQIHVKFQTPICCNELVVLVLTIKCKFSGIQNWLIVGTISHSEGR